MNLKDKSLNVEEKKSLNEKEKADILLLWNTTYPASIALENVSAFSKYLSTLLDQHHTLIKNQTNSVVAWYVDFIRDDERNFVLILAPQYQGKKIGSELMNRAKSIRSNLYGWIVSKPLPKLDGTLYKSPEHFYLKNGFQVHHHQKHKTTKLETIKISWKSF